MKPSDSNLQTILQHRRGAILEITLNRPEARNALSFSDLEALHLTITQASMDKNIRAISLTGAGSVFCAGGDLKSIFLDDTPSPMDIRDYLCSGIRPVIKAILSCDKPVVAVLNGPVAGAGIGIALSTDIVIAGANASLIPAFTKLGGMADSGTLYLMVQNIGELRTKEIMMRGRTLEADEAQALGLYSRVFANNEVENEAKKILDELSNGPTIAHALTKKVLRDAVRMPFDSFMEFEAMTMAVLRTTEDKQEGVRAFAEKRAPVFRGR